jgi:hypothetical protein
MFQNFDEENLEKIIGLLDKRSLNGSNSPNISVSKYLVVDLSSLRYGLSDPLPRLLQMLILQQLYYLRSYCN